MTNFIWLPKAEHIGADSPVVAVWRVSAAAAADKTQDNVITTRFHFGSGTCAIKTRLLSIMLKCWFCLRGIHVNTKALRGNVLYRCLIGKQQSVMW